MKSIIDPVYNGLFPAGFAPYLPTIQKVVSVQPGVENCSNQFASIFQPFREECYRFIK